MKQKKKSKKETIRFILRFLMPCLPLLLGTIVLSAGSTVCSALIPQAVRVGVDGVLGKDLSGFPSLFRGFVTEADLNDHPAQLLTAAALAICLFALINAAASYGSRVMTAKGSEKFVRLLRDSLFGHIQRLPYSWHVKHQTGDIIQRCTSDVEMVRNFVTNQLLEVVRIIFLVIFYLIVMFFMNWKITLAAAAFFPIVILYSGYFFGKIACHFEEADISEGKLSSTVQENLTGVRVVRAFGREAYERKRFDERNEEFSGKWIFLGKFLSLYWSIGDLITGIQILTVICLGISCTVKGEITVGEFMTFVSYNASLAWPIRSLGRIVSEMSKAGVSIDRLRYILDAKEEEDAADAVCPPMNRDIVFDHVNFSYEEGGQVLKDVSFRIPAGSTFAILGNTGSGKSTLVHLLNRLYELPEGCGTISVGGVDIRKIRRDYLRSNIGMVLQEPFLFSGTIRENVGITKDGLSMEEIQEACRTACVHDAVAGFTEGYDTIVGERGVTLSGGQKQRVAIARMLVQKSPVMVFDDSLSAVDTRTDALIRKALKKRMADATVILIAHRITTLMQADCILVLEDGKVREMGTHEELMTQKGIYSRICRIQMNTGGAEDAD